MTITRTTRMEQQQWSSGLDAPTRVGFNADAQFLEDRAAYDDGSTAATLPVTDVVSGRYFRQSFADGYALHRVQGSTWEWVGGTITPGRQRFRRALSTDVAWSTDVAGAAAAATMTAGGELGTAGLVRSVAGGSAGADLSTDLTTPNSTGRWYVRTRASGERGMVAQAHNDNAGPVLTARTAGGSDPWSVDSVGRMRAQAPAAFGAAALTADVPMVSSPSATDVTALDLYGRSSSGAPGLRVFPTAGDATPIVQATPTLVRLGRSSWSGGAVELVAPAIDLTGPVDIAGSVEISDDLTVDDDLTVGDAFSAEGGKVTTYDSGSNYGLTSQVVVSIGGAAMRETRQPLTWRKRILNINKTVSFTSAADIHTFEFAPRTTCNLDLTLVTQWVVFDPGAAATDSEPNTVLFRLRILDDDDSVLFTGDEIFELTLDAYDPHNYVGRGQIVVVDCPPLTLTAGTTYKIQLYGRRDPTTSISLVLKHIVGTLREGALIA